VREALSNLEDEDLRTMILRKVSSLQPKAEQFNLREPGAGQASRSGSLAA
jgi:hypothetical protein